MGEREKPKRPNVISTFYFLICQFTFPFSSAASPFLWGIMPILAIKLRMQDVGEVRFFIRFYISFVVRIFSFSAVLALVLIVMFFIARD